MSHDLLVQVAYCDSAIAQGSQKNKRGVSTTVILFAQCPPTIWAIFLHKWTQCIDGFNLTLEIRKHNAAKNL